jgi:site-specific DNA-methyltransferase (adenine-specific)
MDKQSQQTMFSSESSEWQTPQKFYDKLDQTFKFDLDPCASALTTKCEKYFTPEKDGLLQDWSGHRVFMNPPYGRGVDKWLKKAYEESANPHTTVVCLIPARTDTKYWHKYCMNADEIYFVKGRLKFAQQQVTDTTVTTCCNAAPFPSAVVVFRGPPVEGMARSRVRIATMENK